MPATQSSQAPPIPSSIWCNYKLPAPAQQILLDAIRGRRIIFAFEQQGALKKVEFSGAEIAFGQPDAAGVIAAESLKWVHLTSAGYDRYDRDDLRQALVRRQAILTNSSSVYDDPCAQHVLAFMLAHGRRLPDCWTNQAGRRAWHSREIRPGCQLLTGQNVLLLGLGAIGRRLVDLLRPFEMQIAAIRRTPRGDEPVATHGRENTLTLLPKADHIVNLLPGGEINSNWLGREHFAAMKLGAIFYNVGRGITVDHAALRDALIGGKLAAAYLDVTRPEPLPPDDALWTTPNCYVTPHSAGGHANEYERLVRHFLANLARYDEGRELQDRVMP